jgi:hypothetical protein
MPRAVKAPSTLTLCRRSPKWSWACASRGVFWSAAGSGSATPLWLTLRRPVSWERVAEGSESAVDADALPAQSKMAAGMREPGGLLECGGKRERHAALAYVEETRQLGAGCGRK